MSYVFQRGETISLALYAIEGDPAIVSAITAVLKAVPYGRAVVPADAPVAATFDIVTRPATDDVPAGWTLTIDATTSATLEPGKYQTDARLEVGGGVVITDILPIRIAPSLSA